MTYKNTYIRTSSYEDSFWKEFDSREARRRFWNDLFKRRGEHHLLNSGCAANKAIYLEVHPYFHEQDRLCSNRCVWCTRGDERKALESNGNIGIEPERLLTLINQISEHIHEGVLLSGNCTEPLQYPMIDEVVKLIKKCNLGFRINTNFYQGDKLFDAVKLLDKRDFIRVSLDGFSENAYNISHRPQFIDAFIRTKTNVEELIQIRDKLHSQFGIGLTWIMTKSNTLLNDIRNALHWAEGLKLNSIRFRIPAEPLVGNESFCKDDPCLTVNELLELKQELQTDLSSLTSVNVQFLEEPHTPQEKTFEKCHYYRIMSVLGASGMFFPCTSLSMVSNRNDLGYGDVNTPAFDYLKTRDAFIKKWSLLNPKKFCNGRVSECTRFEFSVNEWLEIDEKKPDRIPI